MRNGGRTTVRADDWPRSADDARPPQPPPPSQLAIATTATTTPTSATESRTDPAVAGTVSDAIFDVDGDGVRHSTTANDWPSTIATAAAPTRATATATTTPTTAATTTTQFQSFTTAAAATAESRCRIAGVDAA